MMMSQLKKMLPGATAQPGRRSLRRWSMAAAILLAACGGGTSQIEPFVPGRVVVLGDDLSTLTAEGRKYAVNGVNTEGGLSCAAEPLWVQSVADYYGFSFEQCNPNAATEFKAIMRAAQGAKVSDIAAQVDAQVTLGGFREKDLVLVLGGMNDIVEIFNRSVADPSIAQASLLADAGARGEQLAAVVNRVVGLQGKVILSLMPDMGVSPFALAQEALKPGSAALLAALSARFNDRLGIKIVLDGRLIGLMQTDLLTQQVARFPSSFGLTNSNAGACTVALPNCTTATLLEGASAGSYFWADGTRLSTGAHSLLASRALDRATRNPFRADPSDAARL